jgi:hypothetical protein
MSLVLIIIMRGRLLMVMAADDQTRTHRDRTIDETN